MRVKVYVEGGGDHNKALKTECRRGFAKLFERAGFLGRMPAIVACGGRQSAYRDFQSALRAAQAGELPMLLVDSESPVTAANPWEHVQQREGDHWQRPPGAQEDHLHFMAQVMEAWFYADKDALARFYGQRFRKHLLAQRTDVENIPKLDILDGLQRATAACDNTGAYSKGGHSFKILELVDPNRVAECSPYAARLLAALRQHCG